MSNALRVGADDGQRIGMKNMREQTMNDLIRREDAIEAYSDIYWIDDRLNLAYREELDKIDEKIRNIPTVEVADRPQGEWIPSDTDGFVCSVCKNGYRNQPTLMGRPMFEYCPVCGARMKGADDE